MSPSRPVVSSPSRCRVRGAALGMVLAAAGCWPGTIAAAADPPGMVDLSRAVVVVPSGLSGPERKAVAMLVEEVARRTHLDWKVESSWPAGTTRLIRPQASACCAVIGLPVSSISIAGLAATARTSGTIGVVQNRPIFTPGVANVASSTTTARSHAATS